MTRLGLSAALACTLFATAAAAQNAPGVSTLRAGYEQAHREWQSLVAGLERDVLTAVPEDVLNRLKAAEASRPAVTAAKRQYAAAVLLQHEKGLAALQSSAAQSRTDAAPALSFGRDTLTDVRADLNTIAQDLKSTPASNAAQLATLRRRRDTLWELRRLYEQRQRLMQDLAAADQAASKANAAVIAEYSGRISALAQSTGTLEQQNTAWSKFYDALRARLNQRMAASAPTPAPATERAAAPPPAVPTPVKTTVPSAPRSLAGKWALLTPRPEKFSDARGPLYGDLTVRVEITQSGRQLTGVYNGVVFVPPSEKYNPKVNFRFSAPVQDTPAVEARIEPPLSGLLRIEWVDDNRIRVSFKIDRTAKASGISFKEGNTKILHRQ